MCCGTRMVRVVVLRHSTALLQHELTPSFFLLLPPSSFQPELKVAAKQDFYIDENFDGSCSRPPSRKVVITNVQDTRSATPSIQSCVPRVGEGDSGYKICDPAQTKAVCTSNARCQWSFGNPWVIGARVRVRAAGWFGSLGGSKDPKQKRSVGTEGTILGTPNKINRNRYEVVWDNLPGQHSYADFKSLSRYTTPFSVPSGTPVVAEPEKPLAFCPDTDVKRKAHEILGPEREASFKFVVMYVHQQLSRGNPVALCIIYRT